MSRAAARGPRSRASRVAGHSLVALEDLGDELAFSVSGYFQTLDLACGR